jgi:hypothetical protein
MSFLQSFQTRMVWSLRESTKVAPNNSFKPTAGVGQLTKQPSRAGGGLILVLGPRTYRRISLQTAASSQILALPFRWPLLFPAVAAYVQPILCTQPLLPHISAPHTLRNTPLRANPGNSMTMLIFLFLLAFAGGLATQEARRAKSASSRVLSGALAIAFTVVYFGYTLGKDMALRDNSAANAPVCTPAST